MNENLLSSFQYIREPEAGILQPMESAGLDMFSMLPMLMQQGGTPRRGRRGGPALPNGGSLDELMIEQPGEGYSTGLHLHWASDTMNNLKVARFLESHGLDVSELTGYQGEGQVTGGHSPNSNHYGTHRVGRKNRLVGNAGDVNYYGGGRWDSEMEALKWAKRAIARRFG